jgi:hypothetical protein
MHAIDTTYFAIDISYVRKIFTIFTKGANAIKLFCLQLLMV